MESEDLTDEVDQNASTLPTHTHTHTNTKLGMQYTVLFLQCVQKSVSKHSKLLIHLFYK